jgi:hypothetical protein
MGDTLEPLILDLVEWVAREPRLYADVLDAWRTSCPRLTVWEDAVDRGLLRREYIAGRGAMVAVTAAGWDLLGRCGRAPATHGAMARAAAGRTHRARRFRE